MSSSTANNRFFDGCQSISKSERWLVNDKVLRSSPFFVYRPILPFLPTYATSLPSGLQLTPLPCRVSGNVLMTRSLAILNNCTTEGVPSCQTAATASTGYLGSTLSA